MCIRYDKDLKRIVKWSKSIKAWVPIEDWTEGLDTFPGYKAPVLFHSAEHGKELAAAQWGMIPFWAKDAKFGKASGYNARSETLLEKPTWREPLKKGRCIVPATGFYERDFGTKRWLKFATEDVMLIAGLYTGPTKHCDLPTFALVTTEPNHFVEEFHDRMPVVLSLDDAEAWLNPDTPVPACLAMLEPAPEEWLSLSDGGPILKPGELAKALESLKSQGIAVGGFEGRWEIDGQVYNDGTLVEFERSQPEIF